LQSFLKSQQIFIPLTLYQATWQHISFDHFLFAFLIFLQFPLIPLLLIQSLNKIPLLGGLQLLLEELLSLALLF
jgi:hypothetical protein